jgi:hypothetical protein
VFGLVAHPSLTHPATDEFNLLFFEFSSRFFFIYLNITYSSDVFVPFLFEKKNRKYFYSNRRRKRRERDKKTCLVFARPMQPLFSVVSRPDFDKVTIEKHRDASGKKPKNII